MTIRTLIFWLHLTAGVVAGSVVLVMSVTGVLLTYEKQMVAWAERSPLAAPPTSGAQRLPVETLMAKVREARPSASPSALTFRADSDEPVTVALGRDGQLLVNAYTGEIISEGATGLRAFFRSVTDWHRYLAASGEYRSTGKAVTGACNLAFLVLVISGAYLWLPKIWSRAQLRNITWFRRGLPGKARDFNWHNTIGFWSFAPLFVVVLSATVISYPWASNLAYRVTGEEPPAPQRAPGAAAGTPSPGGREGGRAGRAERAEHPEPPSLSGLDGPLTRRPTPGARLARHQPARASERHRAGGVHHRRRLGWRAAQARHADNRSRHRRDREVGDVCEQQSGAEAPDDPALRAYRRSAGPSGTDHRRHRLGRRRDARLHRPGAVVAATGGLAPSAPSRAHRGRGVKPRLHIHMYRAEASSS